MREPSKTLALELGILGTLP